MNTLSTFTSSTKQLRIMIQETKIYSDFIKRENVIVKPGCFIYKNTEVSLYKDEHGRWWANEDDASLTKKSAIYWYIKKYLS